MAEEIPRPMSYSRVLEEVQQSHATRVVYYNTLENLLESKFNVVAYFTSQHWPGIMINNSDADMLEEVLQNADTGDGKGLALILNSLGGDALAAERIVNLCRSHCQGLFMVIVPKMAKSAATMIAFGADSIAMSRTSELGPIDPQVTMDKGSAQYAAHHIVESYSKLMKEAVACKGRIEPFLQQLQRYDARDIHWIKSAQELSVKIAVRHLKFAMMKDKGETEIRKRISPFLNPSYTAVHGRPINHDIASKAGLNIALHELKSEFWRTVWQMYVRLNYLTLHSCGKVIESVRDCYTSPIPKQG